MAIKQLTVFVENKHGTLVTDGYVTAGTFVDGGISSPLETFKIIENELKNLY